MIKNIFLLVILYSSSIQCGKEFMNNLLNKLKTQTLGNQNSQNTPNRLNLNQNPSTKDSTIQFGSQYFPQCINTLDIYDQLKSMQKIQNGAFGYIVAVQFSHNSKKNAYKIIPFPQQLNEQEQIEESNLINNEINISKKLNQMNSVHAVQYIECFVGQNAQTLQFFVIIEYDLLGTSLEFHVKNYMNKQNQIQNIFVGKGNMYLHVNALKRFQNIQTLFQSLSSIHNDHKIGSDVIVLRDIKPDNIMTDIKLENATQQQINSIELFFVDFGAAVLNKSKSPWIGTQQYTHPYYYLLEQQKIYTQNDIYALALTYFVIENYNNYQQDNGNDLLKIVKINDTDIQQMNKKKSAKKIVEQLQQKIYDIFLTSLDQKSNLDKKISKALNQSHVSNRVVELSNACQFDINCVIYSAIQTDISKTPNALLIYLTIKQILSIRILV